MGTLLLAAVLVAADPSSSLSADELAPILARGERERVGLLLVARRNRDGKRIKELEAAKGRYFPKIGGLASAPLPREGEIGVLYFSVVLRQIHDSQSMRVDMEGREYWLRGFSTEGLADDERLIIRQPVVVGGTKAYQTVLGRRRTLPLIQALSVDESTLKEAWEKAQKIRKAPKASQR